VCVWVRVGFAEVAGDDGDALLGRNGEALVEERIKMR